MASFGSNSTSGGGSYSAPAKQWTPPPAVAPSSGAAAGASAGASVGSSAPSGGGGAPSKPAAPAGPPPALQHLLGVGAQQASQLWGQAQTVVGMSAKWGVSVNDLYNRIDKPPAGLGTAIKVAVMGTSAEAQAAQQVSGPIKTADPGELPSVAHPSSIPAHQLPAQTFGNPIAKATVSGPISQGQSRPLDFGAPAVNAAGGAAKAIGKSLSGAFGPQAQPTPQVPGTPPAAVSPWASPAATKTPSRGVNVPASAMAGAAVDQAVFGGKQVPQPPGSNIPDDIWAYTHPTLGTYGASPATARAGTADALAGATTGARKGAGIANAADSQLTRGGQLGDIFGATATATPEQTQKAARSAIQNIWSGLLVQGKLPPGASRPNIAFTPNNLPGAWATVDPVGSNTINVTPSLVRSLLGSSPTVAKAAREAIVHEIAHTMQKGLPSVQTPVGRMLTEGGAESFGQAAAGSVGGARNPPAYAQWVQGPGQWVNRGQFGAPNSNFNPVSPAIRGVTPPGLPGISGSTVNPNPTGPQGKLGLALALASSETRAANNAAANNHVVGQANHGGASAPAPGATALPSAGILPQWQQFLQGKGGLSPTVPDSAAAMGASQSGLGVAPYNAGEINKLVGQAPAPSAQGWSNAVPGFNAPGSPAATAPSASAPGSFASPKDLAKGLGGIANALAVGNKPGMANAVATAGLKAADIPVPHGQQARATTVAQSIFPPGTQIQWSRQDQGRDMAAAKGGTPIVANGSGRVLSNGNNPGGFGTNYPIVHFDSGPFAGLDIYFGHTDSALQPGQSFKPGDVISHTGMGTGPTVGNAQTPGWVEVGRAAGGSPGGMGQPTPPGLDQQNTPTSVQGAAPSPLDVLAKASGLKLAQPGQSGSSSGAVAALSSNQLSANQRAFGAEFAKQTGLDPGVVAAWLLAEEPNQASPVGRPGSQNWLNVGITGGGVPDPSGFSGLDPVKAADLTAQWATGKATAGYGHADPRIVSAVTQSKGQPPQQQLQAISSSPWAAGGYSSLLQLYGQLGGNVNTNSSVTPSTGTAPSSGSAPSVSGAASSGSSSSAPTGTTAADQVVNGLLGTGNTAGSGQNPWLTYFQQNTPKDLFGSGTGSSKNPFAISLAQKGLQSLAGVKLTNPLSTSRKVA